MSKVFVRLILGLIFLFSVIFPAVDSQASSGDSTAPVLESLEVSSKEVEVGETVIVKAKITDDLSGVKQAQVAYGYRLEWGTKLNTIFLEYDKKEQLWIGSYTVKPEDLSGVWKFESIQFTDSIDNHRYIHFTDLPNSEDLDIMVNNPIEIDKKPPVLESVEVSPKTLEVGQTLSIKAKVTDDKSGVGNVEFAYKQPNGNRQHRIRLLYDEKQEIWIGNYKIQPTDANGIWSFDVAIYDDKQGNLRLKYANEFSDREVEDLNFEVTNPTGGDFTAPSIESLVVSSKEVKAGETLTFKAKAKDDMSGVAYIGLSLISQSGKSARAISLHDYDEDGELTGTYNVKSLDEKGMWSIDSLYSVDNIGNFKAHDTSQFTGLSVTFLDSEEGSSQQTVNIPDHNLENVIRKELGKPTGDITKEDMLKLTELYGNIKGIIDLTGLEFAENLKKLHLEENKITDIQPLENLNNLEDVSLFYNQVKNINDLKNLTNIKILDLSGNKIKDIQVVRNLTQLETLYLGYNQVTDIQPLANLKNLIHLGVTDNQISNIDQLADLTNLTHLYLYGNQIKEIGILANLTNLTVLNLERNQIEDISVLSNLENLRVLSLKENKITDIQSLANLRNLEDLYLDDNQIIDIQGLASLTNLIQLGLSYNLIEDVDALANLTNLLLLPLSNNKINKVDGLANLNELEYLDLSNNQISDISVISHLRNFKDFNLKGNPLKEGNTPSIVPPPTVNEVTEASTSITGTAEAGSTVIVKIGTAVVGTDKIEADRKYSITIPKQIAGTKIVVTATDDAGNISAAVTTTVMSSQVDTEEGSTQQIVNIPDHNLESVIRKELGKPTGDITKEHMLKLTELYGNMKGITDLTGLEFATNLTSLDLSSNQIIDISPVANLTNLESLDLAGNKIIDISGITNLTNLKSLHLGGNKITDIGPVVSLTQLTTLDLNSHQITDISPVASLTQLTTLNLNNNQIKDISPIANLTNLKFLNLWRNKITDISPLVNLTNLTSLVLGYNQIKDISALSNLVKLTYIDLDGNPLEEDDVKPTPEPDTKPPSAPTGNDVGETSKEITGTAEAGSTVKVKMGTTVLGTALVDENGNYTIKIDNQKAGTILEVTVTDDAGNTSEVVRVEVKTIEKMDECFIATASYGSKFQPSVTLLRSFRDEYLLTNDIGKKFVEFYYEVSPPIAHFIAENEFLKAAVRGILSPIVAMVYLLFHPMLLASVLGLVSILILRRNKGFEQLI